jgi:hypothetical protein
MPGQDEFNPPPAPDLKVLQEDRLAEEEYIREAELRVAELEEKEKYSKIARAIHPGRTDKEIEDEIVKRLSKILEISHEE